MRSEKEAEELQSFKLKSLSEKKDILNNLKVTDLYQEGAYIDAQDTTNDFIMAKIIEVNNNEILVNYDGWPARWN